MISPLAVFLKYGQLYFSKAPNSISYFIQSDVWYWQEKGQDGGLELGSLGKKIKAVTVSQRLLTPPITPISLPHKNSHQNVFKTQHTIKLVLAVISKRSNSFVSDHMVLKKSEMKFPRDMSRAQLHNCGDGNGVEYKWNQNEKCWKYKIEMFSIPSRRKLKKN